MILPTDPTPPLPDAANGSLSKDEADEWQA